MAAALAAMGVGAGTAAAISSAATTAASIAAVAGAAMSAVGALRQGQAQEASYKAQAQANEYNAIVQRQQADTAHQQAGAREDMQRRRARAILGQQRGAASESGFDPGFGSLALVQERSADEATLDGLMIRYEGALQARGLLAQASLEEYGAENSRNNARTSRTAGYISAASELGRAASSYVSMGSKIGGGK